MRVARLMLILALAISIPLAMAQQKQAPEQKPAPQAGQPGAPAMGMMNKPAPEMQKLNFLSGRWITAEKFEPSEFIPKSGTGTGWAQFHIAPGGQFMIETYQSKNDLIGPFFGHAVIFWNAQAKEYKVFWCDSMEGCQEHFSSCAWQGEKLVCTGTMEMEGKKITLRDTFSDIKPESFSFVEENSVDGGPMKLSMTIQYSRGRRPAPAPAPKPNPKP